MTLETDGVPVTFVHHDISLMPDSPSYEKVLGNIERMARICYQSTSSDKKDADPITSSENFLHKTILKNKHHSVIEHESLSFSIITDKGISHELVRHRLASYSQESTRYVDYNKEKHGYTVVIPYFLRNNDESVIESGDYILIKDHKGSMVLIEKETETSYIQIYIQSDIDQIWLTGIYESLLSYKQLREAGVAAQGARSLLPHSIKTQVGSTFNLREIKYIINLRTGLGAHPDFRMIAYKLLSLMKKNYPLFVEQEWNEQLLDREGRTHLEK